MSTTTEPTTQTGEAPGTNNGGAPGGAPAAQPQAGNDEKTFNQSQVNGIIGARLREERQKWEQEQKDAAETAEAEKRGEYEKVLAKERERADKAEAERQAAEQTMRDRIIRAEIRSVATELRFADPADAYRFVDMAAVTLDEATGDPTNVKALLEKLAKDKPYLVGGQQGGAHIPGTPTATGLSQEQFRADEERRMRESGRYAAI